MSLLTVDLDPALRRGAARAARLAALLPAAFALALALCSVGPGVSPAWAQTAQDDADEDAAAQPQTQQQFRPFAGQEQSRGGESVRTAPVGGDVSVAGPQVQRQNVPPSLGNPMQGDGRTPGAQGGQRFGQSPDRLAPFGSQLFTNRTPLDRTLGVNPQYEIQPGDRVAIELWGARNFSDVLTVDLQGNIFLPEIGPINVEGATNARLNRVVRAAVRRVYTQDVNVYTNLLGTQPIGVYLAGAVQAPGHYPGNRKDTLLYYLGRAGGIDPARGSYRRIKVKRDGQVVASADLYDFLTDGTLPNLTFNNNDTILVEQRRDYVTVSGDVRNAFLFELDPDQAEGRDIMALAAPEPSVSHVLVRGLRGGQSFSSYLPLSDFRGFDVQDGDNIVFNSDNVPQEILVSVIGHSDGPSSYTLPPETELGQFAQLVQVNPQVARLDAMYLRRDSVAQQQKRAIERALYELQKTVLTTPSTTTSESQIRQQEAQLVRDFVQQARALEPEGRVVLPDARNWRDVRLEEGDQLVIPNKTDVVLISGEVQVPQTVIFDADYTIDDYVRQAGGLTNRGDSDNVIVVRADGSVHDGAKPIRRGDHVMVLPGVESKVFAIAKDIIEIVFRTALSTATVINASR
jgi:protein involved in polysaccharide export with SLBB domain